MQAKIPRIMLVGAGSGSGKTTLTCALLLALKKRGLNPVAFKCGPDYIDPMFHSKVLGIQSRNLDLFLCGEKAVTYLLAENAKGHDFAVIEGVMGLYDGLGQTEEYSSNQLARVSNTPEVLVINTKGQSLSLVAQIYGYQHFLPNSIKGIIFNQTSEKMYPVYKNMVQEHLGLEVYGYLPPMSAANIASRHLGLIPPEEIENIQERLAKICETAEKTLDLEGLIALGENCKPVTYTDIQIEKQADVTIAIASDKAFCFYYEDNLELLRRMGAKIEFFSPLADSVLPKNTCGLILGGGYPEEYIEKLSSNSSMLASIKTIIESGLPTIAECGGYMYLCRSLQKCADEAYPMVGVIDALARMTSSLQNFGYMTLTAEQDTLLCKKGTKINAHEFHYSDSSNNGSAFTAVKASGVNWQCMHARDHIFAGYPHIHFWGNVPLAQAFIEACAQYKKGQTLW